MFDPVSSLPAAGALAARFGAGGPDPDQNLRMVASTSTDCWTRPASAWEPRVKPCSTAGSRWRSGCSARPSATCTTTVMDRSSSSPPSSPSPMPNGSARPLPKWSAPTPPMATCPRRRRRPRRARVLDRHGDTARARWPRRIAAGQESARRCSEPANWWTVGDRTELEVTLRLADLAGERTGAVSREDVTAVAGDLAVRLGFEGRERTISASARRSPTSAAALSTDADSQAELSARLIGATAGPVVSTVLRSIGEHWDGSGHPSQLAGSQIPIAARIIAVATALVAGAGRSNRSKRSRVLATTPAWFAAAQELVRQR